MNRLKWMAALALCMAYAAGIATGWASFTLAGERAPAPGKGGSWLSHTLDLDDDQKARMEAIWSREDKDRDDPRSSVRALYEERNQQVRAMLTPEQQQEFDAIHETCEEKKKALYEVRRKQRDEAVRQTMAILTPEQQEKYQRILDDFERRDSKRGHSGRKWPKPD